MINITVSKHISKHLRKIIIKIEEVKNFDAHIYNLITISVAHFIYLITINLL